MPRRSACILAVAAIAFAQSGCDRLPFISIDDEPGPLAATQGARVMSYSMADAVPVESLKSPRLNIRYWGELTRKQAGRHLKAGELTVVDDDGDWVDDMPTVPVLVTEATDGSHVALVLRGEPIGDAGWQYLGAGPARRELWGVLDQLRDDPKPDLVLVHSTDAGKTWAVSTLRKVVADAEFAAFAIDHTGKGRLSIRLAKEDVEKGPGKPTAGFYHYRTTDDGKTWTGPEYEPDAMSPAGDPSDDDDENSVRSAGLHRPKDERRSEPAFALILSRGEKEQPAAAGR